MSHGRVLWWNSLSGYGGVMPDDGGPAVFLNVRQAPSATFDPGQRVDYTKRAPFAQPPWEVDSEVVLKLAGVSPGLIDNRTRERGPCRCSTKASPTSSAVARRRRDTGRVSGACRSATRRATQSGARPRLRRAARLRLGRWNVDRSDHSRGANNADRRVIRCIRSAGCSDRPLPPARSRGVHPESRPEGTRTMGDDREISCGPA
jgi:cold shock CspA family protein